MLSLQAKRNAIKFQEQACALAEEARFNLDMLLKGEWQLEDAAAEFQEESYAYYALSRYCRDYDE